LRAIVKVEVQMADMDWEWMIERMQNAMKALDDAQAAKNKFSENANPETFDAFKSEMADLATHLNDLKHMLEHEGVYVEEEMIDIFKRMGHNESSAFRRIPHLKEDDPQKDKSD
jgi:hypothetical protein